MRLTAAGIGGLALAALFGTVAVARRDRPLHAYGETRSALLTVEGTGTTGVPLLDIAAEHPATVRLSRAASVLRTGPDVMGLALRVPGAGEGGGPADLLLATTGTGVVTRHLLAVRTRYDAGSMTTLLPLHAPAGDLVLALTPAERDWTLAWARVGRPGWTPVGTLRLGDPVPDPGHHDPTGAPPAGLVVPTWVVRLRGPAYAAARRIVRLPARRRAT